MLSLNHSLSRQLSIQIPSSQSPLPIVERRLLCLLEGSTLIRISFLRISYHSRTAASDGAKLRFTLSRRTKAQPFSHPASGSSLRRPLYLVYIGIVLCSHPPIALLSLCLSFTFLNLSLSLFSLDSVTLGPTPRSICVVQT